MEQPGHIIQSSGTEVWAIRLFHARYMKRRCCWILYTVNSHAAPVSLHLYHPAPLAACSMRMRSMLKCRLVVPLLCNFTLDL
eukprot:s683_g8.t1